LSPPVVDIGILTIRDDEFASVLKAFPDDEDNYKGRHREYALRTADAGEGARYRLAILRQIEQGNGEAQEATRDLCDDLQPSLILVVGIAGGLPSDDISLGDIVLSTHVHDFSVEARKFQGETTYNVGGGPIVKEIATGVANLAARVSDMGEWWSNLPAKPTVAQGRGNFYGPANWQREVRTKLKGHYGNGIAPRAPKFMAGPIASSDRLVKDPGLLLPWISTARGILAVEMESAGVHRATRSNTPMLSIRGLSDIVGLKRQDAWTKYACAAAAAFTRGYLRTRPINVREPSDSEAGSKSTPRHKSSGEAPNSEEAADEEGFTNLAPLRAFPSALYVAPAVSPSRKRSWELLNQGASDGSHRTPGAWALHEGNLYSVVDPRRSGLHKIIDAGALEEFSSQEWAFSNDDGKRHFFVQLLKAALREDLWGQGVRYHSDQDVFAFMGRPDQPPRRLKYANLKIRSTATVVAHYEQTASNGKTYKHLRHSAFQGRFRWLGEQWFLELTPTYRFTRDGKEAHKFHESFLSGIKRLERNRSVLSQLLIWQAVLRAPWTHADRVRLLEFGPLVGFPFSSQVDEASLTALDAPVIIPSDDEESGE
jgi:nucleoside phosphorylase